MSKSEKKKLGLIPKLLIAIALGTLAGLYLPEWFVRIAVTFSSIFGAFLNFVIPLMIIAFVTKGIADLGEGAGRLLGNCSYCLYINYSWWFIILFNEFKYFPSFY